MTECRLFTGALSAKAYGNVRVGVKVTSAHRLAWEEKRGPVPKDTHVLHTCDTPFCIQNDDEGTYTVNGKVFPRQGHLWLGTNADNTADKVAKGRQSKLPGSQNNSSKLVEEQVIAIRERAAKGQLQRELAACFGVTQAAISLIVRRKKWQHI